MEITLDRVSRDNSELQVKLNKQIAVARDMQLKIEEEKEDKERLREEIYASDRKNKILATQLEDCNLKCEQMEKSKRFFELQLKENKEKMSQMSSSKDEVKAEKRKLEGTVASLETELEECSQELRDAENKAKRAMETAAIMEKELKVEQEQSLKKDGILQKKADTIKELKVYEMIIFFSLNLFIPI